MTVADCVAMNLQSVLAVLQVIRDRRAFGGQLLWLAHRHEAGAEVISQRRREDKATCFDPNYRVDLSAFVLRGQGINRFAQAFGVL